MNYEAEHAINFFLQDLIIFHFEIQRFSPFYLEIIKLLDRATTLEQ